MERVKATIIGAGAVGTAIARELSEEYPGKYLSWKKSIAARRESIFKKFRGSSRRRILQ